tara:strand:- start:111 stop:656 length:546 start_codon:yes stop_codon:yes gene_type:complete
MAADKRVRSFLSKLGLSYDKLTTSTQQYLLDITPSADVPSETISGSIISAKFNNKINNNMSGGRIALPIEYFGTQTSNYQSNVQTTEVDPSLVRNGISFTGGSMSESDRPRCGLLNYKNFKQFHGQYEHKFLRKLKLSSVQKKSIIDSLNTDIENAIITSVKENKYGKLTKSLLNKNLKKV